SVCGDDDGESVWTTFNFGTTANETYGDGIWNGYVYEMSTPYVFGSYLGMVTENATFNRTTTGAWSGVTSSWIGTAPSDHFGVRYKMTKTFPCGSYTFTVGNDDHVRLSIDGGTTWLIPGSWIGGDGCCKNYSNDTAYYFEEETTIDLVMEFYEVTGGATANFNYAAELVAVTITNLTAHSFDLNFGGNDVLNLVISTTVESDPANPANEIDEQLGLTENPYPVANLNPETTYHVYVQTECGGPWNHIPVTTPPTCPVPTGRNTVNIGADTATLVWDASGMSAWNLKVSTTPLIGLDTAVGDFFDGSVATDNYQLTGLTPKTTYYWYVQADCGGGDQSKWSSATTFRTTQIPAELPYTCDFEDPTTNSGWELNNGTQGNKWVNGTAVNNGGTASLYISSNGTGNTYSGTTSYVYAYRTISIPAASSQLEFSFDWKCTGESSWDLGRAFLVPLTANISAGQSNNMAGSNNITPSGWIDIGGGNLQGNNTWTTKMSIIDVPAPGNYNIVFFWKNDSYTNYDPPVAIDNVSIKALSCPAVKNIHTTAVTMTAADIEWTAGGTETEWSVKIVPAGADHSTYTATTVTTASYSATTLSDGTALLASTSYDCWVQANCGTDDNSTWTKYTINMACGAITSLPHSENFDNTATGTDAAITVPNCWTGLSNAAKGPYVTSNDGALYRHSAPNYLDFNWPGAGVYALAALQEIDASIPINTLKVSFYGRAGSATSAGTFTVGVMTDPTDGTTYTPVDTIVKTGVVTQYTVTFENYTGSGQYIAF
ncbi:hypothetical protein LJC68_10635, partial [Bacteroidales bacterium OttesenSCG-928-B11]|nr:hypothetical protein [Bacteroidales bacterium OttesenSCG-928-B11]